MTESQFTELLTLVEPLIQHKDTRMRVALPAKTKLQLTLCFLANWSSFKVLARDFRVPVSSISLFLPETLQAIRNVLSAYMQVKKNKNYNYFNHIFSDELLHNKISGT